MSQTSSRRRWPRPASSASSASWATASTASPTPCANARPSTGFTFAMRRSQPLLLRAKRRSRANWRCVRDPAVPAICISSTACSTRTAAARPYWRLPRRFPSAEIGGGYFQETHPQDLFRECSHFCELISDPAQLPYVLENAIRAAVGRARRCRHRHPGRRRVASIANARHHAERRAAAARADRSAGGCRTRSPGRTPGRRQARHAVLWPRLCRRA